MSAEVQKAIYDALVAASISGVQHIRDAPVRTPTENDFPFIEIGNSQDIPADAGGDEGVEHFIDVHAYSRSGAQKQIKEIAQAIRAALHGQDLTVTGKASAHCWLDSARIMQDRDGQTSHSIQTFQVIHRE